jgi:pyruvate kinase
MAAKSTKIVATVGPASAQRSTLERMAAAGVDVFRINFSHGHSEDHVETARLVREIAAESGLNLALLQDLQGPKIRVGTFGDGEIELVAGNAFTLTAAADDFPGTVERVSISYAALVDDIKPGQTLLLDDGNLRLRVVHVSGNDIQTEVEVGGVLSDHKGVNVPGVALSIEALTEKDLHDLELGTEIGVDWVAQSFVRHRDDLILTRSHLKRLGSNASLMAKIEMRAAVDNFDSILAEADGIMVARGDLGVEMPPEEVPVVQKHLIEATHLAGKPCITATQMLESMIHNPRPTRAETSDVANAIFDGTDAVMLSAETAVGDYPVEAVEMMRRVAEVVESSDSFEARRSLLRPEAAETTPDAIAAAACEVAETLSARAILVFTSSGSSAWRVARNRPGIPVLALTPHPQVRASLALAFGLRAELAPVVSDSDDMVTMAMEHVQTHEMAAVGERIVITAGAPFGVIGTTNLVWVERVR